MSLSRLLTVLALVCFVLATIGVTVPSVALVPAGLACLTLTLLV